MSFTRLAALTAATGTLLAGALAAPAQAATLAGHVSMSGNTAVFTAANGVSNRMQVYILDETRIFFLGVGDTWTFTTGAGCEMPSGTGYAECETSGGQPISADIDLGDGGDLLDLLGGVRATIDGGADGDVLSFNYRSGFSRRPSNVTFYGGTGTDRVNYQGSDTGIHVSLDNVRNDGRPGVDTDNIWSSTETIWGSDQADRISGRQSADAIYPYGGADVVYANGGGDFVNSHVEPVPAADQVDCGTEVDDLIYGTGDQHTGCESLTYRS